MSDLRKAAEMALEVLCKVTYTSDSPMKPLIEKVTDDLSEALAQPEQEPAVWDGWVLREVFFNNGYPCGHREPSIKPQISTTGCICCLQPTEDKR